MTILTTSTHLILKFKHQKNVLPVFDTIFCKATYKIEEVRNQDPEEDIEEELNDANSPLSPG